ncbi:MAG TPA: prolyl oligopeptidase family serine peptidase, partial [Bacteroidales bacterium]
EKVLIDNKKMADKAIEMNVPQKDTFSFVLPSDERLYGWMIKAKKETNRPAPTLFYVYGGPGIQNVLDKYEVKWYHYLAMQGYNVVSVDNRGTSNRGKSFRDATYGKLGEIACTDIVATANYLGQKAWIDTSCLAIMGWSFGGFLAATCLQQSNGLFKAAISVAPPTDWRLYDAAYTERYMGLLEDNEEKYNKTSLIVNADKTNGKLLLIHGTADDNVHVQNTLMFADALVKADKKFEMKLFTDDNHQINSQNAGMQLYNQVIDFLNRVFDK